MDGHTKKKTTLRNINVFFSMFYKRKQAAELSSILSPSILCFFNNFLIQEYLVTIISWLQLLILKDNHAFYIFLICYFVRFFSDDFVDNYSCLLYHRYNFIEWSYCTKRISSSL